MRKSIFLVTVAGLMLTAGGAFAQTPGAPQPKISDAGPGDIRMLAINSFRTAFEEGRAGAEKAAGHHIVIQYGTASGNLKAAAMTPGQDFEIALLTPDVNADLAAAGKTAPGATQIAQGSMGFALEGDAKVDVSTPDAIRKTLLGAKAVVFSPQSSGIDSIKKMLGDLGITDTIKHIPSGGASQQIGPGEYYIYLYPMSEIVTGQIVTNPPMKGIGVFPDQWQVPVIVQAVTGAHARDGVKALMDYLKSPAMTAILIKDGWKR